MEADARSSRRSTDWAGLDDGPAGLIAESVLAHDVVDYVHFRAVCRSWRKCCTEPRSHSGLDRRFHPRRWTMLREEITVTSDRCRFLNLFTGECIRVDIPELRDHALLALTPGGLLVLAHKPPGTTTLCLLNPLTRHLIQLPPLNTLVPTKYHDVMLPECGVLSLDQEFIAWGSGIANDDLTVVLCLTMLNIIGMAKPGDDRWTLLDGHGTVNTTPIMFEGRFYCVNHTGVMVLESGRPRLEVAAKLNIGGSAMADIWHLHLVNNYGELILLHSRNRWCKRLAAENEWVTFYDVYRVDLDNGTLIPVKSLGGRAVFMGMYCSLSVSPDDFPSGYISADTIYLSSYVCPEFKAYHLSDGSSEGPTRYQCRLVPRPDTLVDCLLSSVTP